MTSSPTNSPTSRPASSPARFLTTVLRAAALLLVACPALAQKMPRADVIDVPAIGAELCVHNLFQSHMVVQRDKPIAIWGWAAPGESITVAFAGKEGQAKAGSDRSWRVTLPAMPANSEPQAITIRGRDKILTLDDVLVGDVWVLGGQSNMEFPLERVDNGWLEIVSARYDGLRILTVPAQNGPETKRGFPRLHEWSGWFSRHFRKGDWDVCSPKIAQDLSAIGYVFARRIHMATRIPIGIIDVSRGGTTVETWTPEPVLREIGTPEVNRLLASWKQKVADWNPEKDLANRVKRHEQRVRDRKKKGQDVPADWTVPTNLLPGPVADQNRPGNCYRSMLAPIAGLSVKGAIFHQGYNNALGSGTAGAAMYHQIFGRMIAAWREAFGDLEMPFGIISLCTDGVPQSLDNYCEKMLDDGVYIREAQYRTFLDLYRAGDKNIGFASSFDKRRSWYHPQQKIPVGERISRWALATQYGLDRRIRWTPPMSTEMKVEDGKIILAMDRNVAPPDNKTPIVGFAIAGKDRRFHPATAEWFVKGKDNRNRPQLDRRKLVLTSPHVPNPIHFRYAWGRNPMGNLQSADHSDLPFATQRSDDWKMEEVPLGVLGDEAVVNGKASRQQRRKILQALRKDDLERRLRDARALLEKHER